MIINHIPNVQEFIASGHNELTEESKTGQRDRFQYILQLYRSEPVRANKYPSQRSMISSSTQI